MSSVFRTQYYEFRFPNLKIWVQFSGLKIWDRENFFQKIRKISNFQKCSKSFPEVFKRVLNMFWGNFFEKNFCPVFHGGSSLRKIFEKSKNFQNSKNAQNRSQKCSNVFWTCFGVIFPKKFFPQYSMEGRVFENFSKNQKVFKIPKMPNIVPKSVQRCFEHVLG